MTTNEATAGLARIESPDRFFGSDAHGGTTDGFASVAIDGCTWPDQQCQGHESRRTPNKSEVRTGLKVGDAVIVVDRGHICYATVEKAARVWLTLVMVPGTESGGRYATWRMRRDTQNEGGTVYSHSTRFYTLEQWAAHEAESDARKVLSAAGISVDYGSPFRMRHLAALAAFVQATMEAERKVTRDGV